MTTNDALKEIGENLSKIGAALIALAEGSEEAPKQETPKAAEPKPKKAEPEKKYTLEDVRKALAAKSGEGFTEEVKALLGRHGGSKLSAIEESEYAAIMEEVEEIGSTQ